MNDEIAKITKLIANFIMLEELTLDDSDEIYDAMEILGYDEDDISAALILMEAIPVYSMGAVYGYSDDNEYTYKMRVAKILTLEASNILSMMGRYDVIDIYTVEEILDRAEAYSYSKGAKVNLDEMKGIINNVILENISHGVDDVIRIAAEGWSGAYH